MVEAHAGEDFELIVVAVDAQGADKPRPYMERARATFTCVIDATNLLSRIFGFKVVPNGVLVDATGKVAYQRFGGFDIRNPETRELVEVWLRTGSTAGAESTRATAVDARVSELFEEGLTLLRGGRVARARAKWREASTLDPGNYVVHKQLWSIENPEKFYGEHVDMAWQKEQLARGL